MRGLRRVNTATLEPWQRRNGEFESKLEYEIHGKFHEHERDVKGVDTTAWVALVDMLPAYEDVDALSDAIDAFDLRRCWRSGRASWRSSRLRRWQEAHMRRLAGRGWVLHRPLGWTPTFYHQDPPA